MDELNDLNSETSLHFRLLELLPLEELKSHSTLKKTNTKIEAIENILETYDLTSVRDLYFNSFGICRQHVYMFSQKQKLDNLDNVFKMDLSNLDLTKHQVEIDKTKVTFILLHKISQMFISQQENVSHFEFYVPIKIEIFVDLIIFKFVILERSSSQFKSFQIVGRFKRKNEDIIKRSLIPRLKEQLKIKKINELDLNKGVKYLWDKDIIDSDHCKTKETDSTHSRTMDAGKLLKMNREDLYKEMIKDPLLKNSFVFLESDKAYVHRLAIDPTYGRLSFTSFNHNNGVVDNVIQLLLRHN